METALRMRLQIQYFIEGLVSILRTLEAEVAGARLRMGHVG